MVMELGTSSDYSSIVAINLFVALLSACIVIGHLLEENRWMNESVTALIIGLGSGAVILFITQGKNSHILVFSEDLFFNYLLPPIIFNAGFQVKKKKFFRNFMTIMLFGAVGTLISFVIISLGAIGLFHRFDLGSLEIGDFLAIGAIFSATDSVCTLQVLNQDETPLLYSLVFGEGVVNDATSIVLFNAIQNLDLSHFNTLSLLNIIGSFLYLFILSTLLGVFAGLLSAYIIKKLYFGRHSTDREIAIMILMAYLSYMSAELLDLSGILTVFFCGIVMSHYTWHNVTESSRITTKHSFATLSFIAETLIFLYVGMDALDIEKWKFVSNSIGNSISLSSIILGLVMVGRAAFVFPLSFLSNITRKSTNVKITFRQQVIIWWAGLMRGAVSIALAYNKFTIWGHTQLQSHAIMITSTITVVLFSTLVFGILTKPLVRLLIPKRHLTHDLSSFSEDPPTPKSHLIPLLTTTTNDQDPQQGQNGISPPDNGIFPLSEDGEARRSILRPESLRMLLEGGTRTVHHYWRKFDDGFMRPVFGGRGFVQYVPVTPHDRSAHDGGLVPN